MTKNERGEYIDCFAHSEKFTKTECTALDEWYNCNTTTKRCDGCPFYKSKRQMEYERIKYPVIHERRD